MNSIPKVIGDHGGTRAGRPADASPATTVRAKRHLNVGSILFEPGDHRRCYRVESGAICHYTRSDDGPHELIEFVFSGDIIGLGGSACHVSTARAMVETELSALTEDEIDQALSEDPLLFFRLAGAADREFDYLKRRALQAADVRTPIQRLANFLLALVSIDAAEGREAVIADDVSSRYVAEQLQMSIDFLATVLLSLRQSGVVEVSDRGLRILDIAALEALA